MGVDKYGHCIICHRDMILNRVVGGKSVPMFHTDHDHTEFVINNKSKLVVCMCKICKSTIDLHDENVQKDVMKSVLNGWKMEQETLISEGKQTIKEATKIIDSHKKLDILFHSEGIDDYVINDRLNKIEAKK